MNFLFTSPELLPFTISFTILIFILAIELVGFVFGFSSFNDNDVDFDFDPDVSMDVDADLDIAFGDPDIDIDVDADFSFWSFLELGRVPLLVWLLSMVGSFTIVGYGLQFVTAILFGFMWPGTFAGVLVFVPAFILGKTITTAFSKILPKSYSQAVSVSSLGGRVGYIETGVAKEGYPAFARVSDHYGNPHTIRVVPFKGEGELTHGTRIVVLRGERDGIFNALSLDKAKEQYNQRVEG